MVLKSTQCQLRAWRAGDEEALAQQANNRKIWRNMGAGFPHPYMLADAQGWIAHCAAQPDAPHFAVVVNGELAGGAGYVRLQGELCHTAAAGYWLGEPFWGRGIATDALRRLVMHVFQSTDIHRLEAGVYAWNPASARVLEKAGFTFEARLRKRVFKDGQHVDVLMYALLRDEAPTYNW